MSKIKHMLLLCAVLILFLAACGGGGGAGAPAAGDATRGKSLFEQAVIGPNSAPGCATCHSLEPGVRLVGPSQAQAATEAAERIKSPSYTGSAKTGEEYLRESIVNPEVFVAEGFPAGVMYPNYGKDLSDQDIDDLVTFLLTLK